MFCKVSKRKTNICSLFPLFSLVIVVCSAIFCFASLLSRSQKSPTVRLTTLQYPIRQTPDHIPCATCKPCSSTSSVDAGDEGEEMDSPERRSETVSDVIFINCSIPYNSDVVCLRRQEEVYLPASFVKSYFEVYGEIKESEGLSTYQFQYSYGNLFKLQNPYHPSGVFNNFDHYNVEQRSKILCVTATDGVPLTSQWKADGYYYPITVAQHGLSHHAKGLVHGTPEPRLLTNGIYLFGDWIHPGQGTVMESRNVDIGYGQRENVMFFSTLSSGGRKGPGVKIPRTKNSSLCLDVFLNGTGEMMVTIVRKDGSVGYVHFDYRESVWDTMDNGHVYYGLGMERRHKWTRLVRDISVDWNKAFSRTSIRSPSAFNHITNITFVGSGYVTNFTIAASHHIEHLIKAADWLVSNQDSRGGWPIDFAIKTGHINLEPGWYSAMGQGQAMSTLVRAYNVTGKLHYLEIAEKALNLFTIRSDKGGVKTQFMDKLDWYEEYPTTPYGTFVLNGFIFSLLGLYDVMVTVDGEKQILANSLWDTGLRSLKTMLGMFDSGTGTFYDLRHVVYHDQPNRVRWDYHMVHIQLVQQLAIIDGDPIFNATANRWIQYSRGTRAKHN